ncbi:hypothetical protein SCG7086_AK_00130 [Chlamydiales bacterium SCGC AG-110-P3]|nr:hypothetical protein SCG7086_AK_00130 [Chlamydiales bacterium SCGC AG-110-P3]
MDGGIRSTAAGFLNSISNKLFDTGKKDGLEESLIQKTDSVRGQNMTETDTVEVKKPINESRSIKSLSPGSTGRSIKRLFRKVFPDKKAEPEINAESEEEINQRFIAEFDPEEFLSGGKDLETESKKGSIGSKLGSAKNALGKALSKKKKKPITFDIPDQNRVDYEKFKPRPAAPRVDTSKNTQDDPVAKPKSSEG